MMPLGATGKIFGQSSLALGCFGYYRDTGSKTSGVHPKPVISSNHAVYTPAPAIPGAIDARATMQSITAAHTNVRRNSDMFNVRRRPIARYPVICCAVG